MPNAKPSIPRPDLNLACREFERWRRTRARGARIPEALWCMALDAAVHHGVSKAAQALRLDYYGVKRRLAAAPNKCRSAGPAPEFVELTLPVRTKTARCQVELRDVAGDGLRIDVTGLSAQDLALFVRAVAGRDACSK